MPRLPYPCGAYHPSLAPTIEQREQMLSGKSDIAQAQLKTRWMRYEYVPGPDATEYDGPCDPFGDPDFVCYKRWEAARAIAASKAPSFIGAPPVELDEEGFISDEYWAYAIRVLQYVLAFAEADEPREFFSSVEDTIETRQVFAVAPRALQAITAVFKQKRREDKEWARERLHANTKPLSVALPMLEEKEKARAERRATLEVSQGGEA